MKILFLLPILEAKTRADFTLGTEVSNSISFINFTKIFPSHFVLTAMYSQSTMQQMFKGTILYKARTALVIIIKIILTRQEHFVVMLEDRRHSPYFVKDQPLQLSPSEAFLASSE